MSDRMKAIRNKVRQLRNARPFHPFILNLENGEHVLVTQPENIALHAGAEDGTGGSAYFYVIGAQRRVASTFDVVTNIVSLENAEV